MTLAGSARPRLARKARLRFDAREDKNVLLSPERGLVLNETAASVLGLCDGIRTIDAIVDALAAGHAPGERARIAGDVMDLLERLVSRTVIELAP